MAGAGSALAAADGLCRACVELLEVDGASVSLVHAGAPQGTFGSSGEMSRRLDALQFTFGEGPCLDAVRGRSPVLVADLAAPDERRWPAFRGAVLESGVNAVFALPVVIATSPIGALDLFCHRSGSLTERSMSGALLAAELAALPLLDLMGTDVDWDGAGQSEDGWAQVASLDRVEIYQATGMIMAALDVSPADALVRLRAHAFAYGMTASEAAWAVVERRLSLDSDDWHGKPGQPSGGSR